MVGQRHNQDCFLIFRCSTCSPKRARLLFPSSINLVAVKYPSPRKGGLTWQARANEGLLQQHCTTGLNKGSRQSSTYVQLNDTSDTTPSGVCAPARRPVKHALRTAYPVYLQRLSQTPPRALIPTMYIKTSCAPVSAQHVGAQLAGQWESTQDFGSGPWGTIASHRYQR